MKLPIMGHIAVWSTVIPAVVGVWRFGRLDKAMKYFAAFCVVSVVNVFLEVLLGRLGIRNYFVSDLYFLVAVPFFGIVYHFSIKARVARNVLKLCTALFVLVWLIQKAAFWDPNQLSSTLAMVTALFLVIMSIVTLNTFLKSSSSRLTGEPIFWVLTGTIVYYSGTFVVMGLGNELLKISLSMFETGWYINWILIVVSMLMYTKGFLCKSQV